MCLSTGHSKKRIYHFRVRAQQRHRKDELQPWATSNIREFPFHYSSAHSLSPTFLFLASHSALWHAVMSQMLQKHIDVQELDNKIIVIFFKIAKILHSVIAVFSQYAFTNTIMIFQLERLGLDRTQHKNWSSTNHKGNLLEKVTAIKEKVLERNKTV